MIGAYGLVARTIPLLDDLKHADPIGEFGADVGKPSRPYEEYM